MSLEQITTEPTKQVAPSVESEEFKFEMTDFGPSYATDRAVGYCSCICHSCICSCARTADEQN